MLYLMRKHNKLNKIVFLITTVFFFIILLSSSLFHHVHVTKDGKIIEHSHPFPGSEKKESSSQHTHSKYNYLFYHHTTNPNFVSVFILFAFFIVFFYFIFLTHQNFHKDHYINFQKTRAPPA